MTDINQAQTRDAQGRPAAPAASQAKTAAPQKTEKITRQHVLLKSGNGTVAIEDYDEKIHGKAVEETDEQYAARIKARQAGAAPPHPNTTIANLATFDTASAAPGSLPGSTVVAPLVPATPSPVQGVRVGLETPEAAKARQEAAEKAQAAKGASLPAGQVNAVSGAAGRPAGASPAAGTTSGEAAHQASEANKA